jgi:hypothetical protein
MSSIRRFHLSTAIAVMFFLGLLLGINFVGNPPFQIQAVTYKSETAEYFGWPMSFIWRDYGPIEVNGVHFRDRPVPPVKWSSFFGLFVDLLLYTFALGIIIMLLEYRVFFRNPE